MGCHDNHECLLPKSVYLWGYFLHTEDAQEIIWHQFKIVLGCKVVLIRSWSCWFEAKLSFHDVYICFHLIYKTFINILEYANEVISYTNTRQNDLSNCIIADI